MPGLQPSLAESCVLSPELAVPQSGSCKEKNNMLSFFPATGCTPGAYCACSPMLMVPMKKIFDSRGFPKSGSRFGGRLRWGFAPPFSENGR